MSQTQVLQPVQGGALALLTLMISLGTFMEILDITIANVAVATIAGDLGVSPQQGTAIISSYSIACAIALPLTGWLARRFGEVRVFVAVVSAFTAASMLAALSTSLEMLVSMRLLQGLAGGPILPLSQTLLLRCYPPEKRGQAMGLWAMVVVIAPVIGPVLGGYLVDHVHWSWLFLINGPAGIAVAYTTWKLMKNHESERKPIALDRIGFALLVIGVGSLQWVLEHGREEDWFESPKVLAATLLGLLAMAYFVAWSWSEKEAVVDLSLLRQFQYTAGVSMLTVGFMTYYASVVVFPLWLLLVMGYNAVQAGLAIAPIAIFNLIFSPLVGRNIHRLNPQYLSLISFSLLSLTSYWSGSFTLEAGYWEIIMPRLLQGLGMAIFFIPIQSYMLSLIANERLAAATGFSNFSRMLGAALGAAIGVTAWDHWAAQAYVELGSRIQALDGATIGYLEAVRSLGIGADGELAVAEQLVFKQAYMMATNQFFHACALIFALMALILALTWAWRPPWAKQPVLRPRVAKHE
ncbi:MAG: DHA2 family efflux MFS transporter permease subunit [Betaproteobacteria bacterium]|nr:DHA2 family efflux MFS transporter permease subunit [Betaproteobacteria bacterium]